MSDKSLHKVFVDIRRKRYILLYDMAKQLGLKPHELSEIEHYKRIISEDFINKIIDLYNLDAEEQRQLKLASKGEGSLEIITPCPSCSLMGYDFEYDYTDQKRIEKYFNYKIPIEALGKVVNNMSYEVTVDEVDSEEMEKGDNNNVRKR